jgi:putrescine transport system ATP-binding protein
MAGGSVRLECTGTGAIAEVDAQDVQAGVGDTAWFAVRPEKVRVSLAAPADPSVNAISGEVWDIEYLGDVSIYHVRLPSGATLKATVANATRLVERPITWEDKVWLTWSRDGGVVLTR